MQETITLPTSSSPTLLTVSIAFHLYKIVCLFTDVEPQGIVCYQRLVFELYARAMKKNVFSYRPCNVG